MMLVAVRSAAVGADRLRMAAEGVGFEGRPAEFGYDYKISAVASVYFSPERSRDAETRKLARQNGVDGRTSAMRPLLRRAGFGLLLLTLAVGSVWAVEAVAAGGKPTKLYFESAGRKIEIDLYPAAGTAPHRTIIVLHGAGGSLLDGPEMRRVARELAAAGDTVYVLHYFDRTCTIFARLPVMEEHFDDWQATVREAITWVHAREGEHPARIGVYGYSLGAFLAVAAASNNPEVGAIAEQAGGMWNSQEQRVGKMPSVLMIHGRADQRVPFEKYAQPLLRVLQERGGHVETHFVDGEGHGFTPSAMAVVRTELVKYFDRELQP
jgi:dienelactone hydrolase